MNLLYISPDMYNTKKHAGGMGTKTKAMQNAWRPNILIDVTSKINLEDLEYYDLVMIELLGFRNSDFQEKLDILKESEIPVVVYGSDSEILRWSGSEINALKDVVSLWIPNMEWQANYFRDFDLPVTDVVYEPIDCDLFRPSNSKQRLIVAGGAINHEKQSGFFIDLFGRLKDMNIGEYQTTYIGSASLWGGHHSSGMKLENELKKVTDIFHGSVPQSKVASIMSKCAVAVLNPFYETCNRFDQELMASGVARICGQHVCYDERLTVSRFTDVDNCIEELKELTNGFAELPDPVWGVEAREHAVIHWSYESSTDQIMDVVKIIML